MEKHNVYGVEYISGELLTFGDYGGAGSVGKANIQYVLEQAKDSLLDVSYKDIDAPPSSYYVGEAQEAFESGKRPLVLHATGGYGSETVYILAGSELAEEIEAALAGYPVLDDSLMCDIESQWEREAWESWVKSALERAMGYGRTKSDAWDSAYEALEDKELYWVYTEAMETHNESPTPEHSGVWVPVDKIAATYETLVSAKLGIAA